MTEARGLRSRNVEYIVIIPRTVLSIVRLVCRWTREVRHSLARCSWRVVLIYYLYICSIHRARANRVRAERGLSLSTVDSVLPASRGARVAGRARAPAGAAPAAPSTGPGRAGGGPGRGGGRAAGLAVARAGAQNQYRPIFNLVLCRTCRRPIQPRGPPQPVLDPAHAFAHARLGDQAGADVGDLASVHATTDGDIAVD